MRSSKHQKLSRLFDNFGPPIVLNCEEEKYVVFSDQHIGMPEFDHNKRLYLKALESFYGSGHKLIIAGDYEELHRYGIKKLKQKYSEVYALERKFLERGRYFRLFGNHDIDWKKPWRVKKSLDDVMPRLNIVEALKFSWKGNDIFLVHGHQGEFFNDTLGIVGRIILRFLARPLRISSLTSPAKRYIIRRKDEREYYSWAKNRKVLLIAGHTHRPVFESLTKADRIRINIDHMLRKYVREKDPDQAKRIRGEIAKQKADFERIRKEEGEESRWRALGESDLVTPCYCNDGSCLHENGITCIEFCQNKIRLLLLYDAKMGANVSKHLRAPTMDLLPDDPKAAGYKIQILEEEELEYVFTKIQLLS